MQMLGFKRWAGCALVLFAAATMAVSTRAALITDSYQFANSASDGSTVTGTFTYDTSNPSVVTDLTMNIAGASFDSNSSFYPPILPTFDGSELIGSFDINYPEVVVLVDDSGTFGPGATGTATENTFLFGIYPGTPVTVSGPIIYDLNGSVGGSAVPLPPGAWSASIALVALAGARWMRRRLAIL